MGPGVRLLQLQGQQRRVGLLGGALPDGRDRVLDRKVHSAAATLPGRLGQGDARIQPVDRPVEGEAEAADPGPGAEGGVRPAQALVQLRISASRFESKLRHLFAAMSITTEGRSQSRLGPVRRRQSRSSINVESG
jgi:hypothetical protein